VVVVVVAAVAVVVVAVVVVVVVVEDEHVEETENHEKVEGEEEEEEDSVVVVHCKGYHNKALHSSDHPTENHQSEKPHREFDCSQNYGTIAQMQLIAAATSNSWVYYALRRPLSCENACQIP